MRAAVASEKIAFLLNGRPVCAEGVSPQTTLLDFLRGLGLTGAKEGCAEGECGACAVVLVAEDGAGSCYPAVNSCLMLVPMAEGQEIYTVESLAQNSELAPVQQALAEAGGSQCGYCTPGFVMSLFAEQYRPGRTSACDPHQLGNLCRCTGYRPIRDAARSLGPPPQGPFLDRLAKRAPKRESLHFEEGGRRFSTPTTIDECVALLADDPEVYLIAGGTDLAVESNLKYRRWRHLV